MNYTRGEWHYKRFQGDVYPSVITGDHIICQCQNTQLSLPENEANAQLISAAPDLYEELKKAATTIHNMIRGTEGEYRETLQAQLKEILKAIAKVEGDK